MLFHCYKTPKGINEDDVIEATVFSLFSWISFFAIGIPTLIIECEISGKVVNKMNNLFDKILKK